MKDELDCASTDYPVCPYCGHEMDAPWEIGGLMEDGADEKVTCGSCGEHYKAECSINVEFTTAPVGGWEE